MIALMRQPSPAGTHSHFAWPLSARGVRVLVLLTLLVLAPAAVQAQVRISAFYGNTAASAQGYRRNFVELFNAGSTPVNLTNWTIQYATATGTSWQSRTITTGVIQPRAHFLIALASTDVNTAGLPLPTADFTLSSSLATSASGGKLAIYSGPITNTGACPLATNLVDFIGYGPTADCRSPLTGGGPGNNAPAMAATSVLVRTNLFQSVNPASNSNGADFIAWSGAGTHLPRTGATPVIVIDGSAGAAYGSPIAIQNTQTSAGDATTAHPQSAAGSELDQVFAAVYGGTLHLTLAGNIETANARINLFIDSAPGGQSTLRSDNAFIGRMGDNGDGAGAPGMKFPAGFVPDHWVSFVNPVTGLAVDYGTLPSGAAGSRNRLGTNTTAAAGDGTLTGGDWTTIGHGPSGGVRATLNNSNTGGVGSGSSGASGAGVNTGIEVAIPLWMLGSPVNPSALRVFACVTTADFSTSFNQALAGCDQCTATVDSSRRDWSASAAAAATAPYRSPIISSQPPTSVAQCAGTGTIISIAAADVLAYQWQQSTDGGATWANASGQNTTAASMTTAPSATAGTRYRCIVVNANGQTVSNSTDGLTIHTLPSSPGGQTSYSGAVGVESPMTVSLAPGETADWHAGSLCTGTVLHTGASFPFVPAAAGVYQFTVRARNIATGCASATCHQVTLTASPANDTCAGATPLSLNLPVSGTTAGASADFSINATAANFTGSPAVSIGHTPTAAPGRDVVYTFSPPATGLYSVRVTGYPTFQNLIIYASTQCSSPLIPDPTGGEYLRAANRTTSTGAEALYGLSLTAGTMYYLIVDDTGSGNTGGPFTIEVNRSQSEVEPNNSPATATSYLLGESGMEFTMSPAGEADFFALGTPEAGSRIFAMIDGIPAGTGDTQLRLTNSTGTLEFDEDNGDVAFGASGFSSVLAGAVADGNPLFLRANLFSMSLSNEPYRLYAVTRPPIAAASEEVEPNDTPAAAQRAPTNYFAGATTSAGDTDLYAFTAYAGQMVMLGLDCYPNHTISGVGIDGTLGLVDSTGATLISVNGASVSGGDNGVNPSSGGASLTSTSPSFPGEALVYRVRASGTYYARVTATSAGPYLLSISTFPTPSLCSAGSSACAEAALRPHIADVQFHFLSNTSSDSALSGCFQDFTTQSTTLHRGLSYPLTVTIANDTPGDSVAAWLDWNQDFDLSDPGERIELAPLGSGVFGVTIAVPSDASLGPSRMRLRVGNSTDSPCGLTTRGEVEDYTIDILTAVAPPANDTCSTPITLSCGDSVAGTVLAATADSATLPNACAGPTGPVSQTFDYTPGVWYTLTVPGTAGIDDRTVTIDTLGSQADTRLWVLTGTCGSLTCITASDNLAPTSNASRVAWAATAGQMYRIFVGATGPATDFTLNVACNPTPANDSCANPTLLTSNSGSIGSTLGGATGSLTALPACDTRGGFNDVWFTYTPACSGLLTLDTCGSADTLLSIHAACPESGNAHQLAGACNDDSPACGVGSRLSGVAVTAGTAYLVRVSSADATAPAGPFTLTWSTDTAPPVAPSSVAADAPSYCITAAPTTITLTAEGGSGGSLNWYAATCSGTPIGSGPSLNLAAPTQTTTYHARWENSCGVTECRSVTVTVLPAPIAPSLAEVNTAAYCRNAAPASISLTAVGGAGASLEWFAGSCNGTSIGAASPLTIAAPTATTTYFVRWVSSCGQSSCASVTVTVTPDPTSPTSAAATPDRFCAADAPATITLTATGGEHGPVAWFAGACGDTPIGTGETLIIPSPTATTTYFARRGNTCGQSSCTGVTVTVDAAAVAPTSISASTATICQANRPNEITLSALGGSGASIEWFAGTCEGASIGTGPALTIPAPLATTTYLARWTGATCAASACASTTVTVADSPSAPTSVTASAPRYCADAAPSTITLTAIGGSGETLQWYAETCNGAAIGTGPSLVIAAPTSTTTYLARWATPLCDSSACVATVVTVDPAATPPESITASSTTFCSDDAPDQITLTATGGSGEGIQWFTGECGTGTPISQGSPLTIPAPTSTTTYHARWVSQVCGTSACRAITVTVQPAPVADAGGPYLACAGALAQLSGSAQHHASTQWSTTGDGTFADAASLTTTYTPGPADLLAGTVTLTLTSDPITPCSDAAVSSALVNLAAPTTVYVDDNYTGLVAGSMVNFPHNGQPGPYTLGCNAHATITSGVQEAAVGGQVMIAPGEYTENVVIAKRLTLIGAGAGTCGAGSSTITSLIAADPGSPALLINDAGGATPVQRLSVAGMRISGTGIGVAGVRAFAAAEQMRAHLSFTSLVITSNGGPGLHLDGYGSLSDIELTSSEICNNFQGVIASATLAMLDGFSATGIAVHDNTYHGMLFLGRASSSAISPTNIRIVNSTFAANGQSSDLFDGSGDLLFRDFNGNAVLDTLTFNTTGRRALAFIGRGGVNPIDWSPLGVVSISDVEVSGTADRAGCAFLQYADLSGVALTGLNLSGMSSSAAPFGNFATVGLEVQHSGASPLSLADTQLPCQGGQSTGYVGIAVLGTGGVQATCQTSFGGATTLAEKQGCVLDAGDLPSLGTIEFGDIDVAAEPAGGSVCTGQPFEFSVVVQGQGPISYQWFRGSTPVGTNAPTLTIASASPGDAEFYTVVVSNACGAISTSPVILDVFASPIAPAAAEVEPASYCAGSIPTTITLTALGGSGDGVTWYAETCGSAPIGAGASITIPAPLNTTTYFARWQSASCGVSACVSTTVTVNAAAIAPTGASADVTSYCSDAAPAAISLSAAGGSGDMLRWYAGDCGGTPIGTGASLMVPAPLATTTYLARWETAACGTSLCATVTITVNRAAAKPTSVTADIANYCASAAPEMLVLSAVGGSGDSLEWTTSCGGTVIGTGSPLAIPAPLLTTTYFARWVSNECGTSACESTTIIVDQNPATPTDAAATPAERCDSGSITLTASAGSGEIIDWYRGGCMAAYVGSGSSMAVQVSESTTFHARARNIASGCESSSCQAVSVTINPLPVAPTGASASTTSLCIGGPANITLTAEGGVGDTLRWYSTSCGQGPIGAGSPITIAAPTASTTYFARWESASCGASSCASVAVTVRTNPTAHAGVPVTICSGGVAPLAGVVTNAASTTWSTTGTGTFANPNAPATVYFPSSADISAGTVILTLTAQPETPCGVSATSQTTLTILPAPVAPTSLSSNKNDFCPGAEATVTLTAEGGSGATVAWFSGSCGGNLLGSGSSITVPAPTTTTTYFAASLGPCGASICTSLVVSVRAMPEAPTGINASHAAWCPDAAPTQLALTAIGGSGETIQWFAGSCSGTPIGAGPAISIAPPTTTTTYHARWINACGQSECASTTVTVRSAPVAPASASIDSPSFCAGAVANITLTANGGSGDVLRWYRDACGEFPIGTGSTLVIAAPSAGTHTYFARWESLECGASTCAEAEVTATPPASPPTSIVPSHDNYCASTVSTITLSAVGGDGDTVEWYDDACGGNLIGTGNPLSIPAPSATTTFFARWTSTCGPSTCVSETVDVVPEVGACCTGWGTLKTCQVMARDLCAPTTSPTGVYRGDCTVCAPTSCCPADFNNSGAVTVQDIFDFLGDLLNGQPSPAADFNNSGAAGPQDIFDFLSAYFVGC